MKKGLRETLLSTQLCIPTTGDPPQLQSLFLLNENLGCRGLLGLVMQ